MKISALIFAAALALAANPTAAQTPSPPGYSALGGSASLTLSGSTGRVALPTTAVPFGALTIFNSGSADGYFKLGDSTVTATTSDTYVKAGTSLVIWVGSSTYLAGITGGSASTFKLYQATGPIELSTNGGAPGGAAGGDLTGSYPNPSVAFYNGGTPFGSAAAASTGTSGATVPLLNGNNTFSGTVKMSTLPTADPHSAGQLWNNAGALQVSGG